MLKLLVSRCQIVAGSIIDSASANFAADVASLRAAIPETTSVPERLIIRSLIACVISRVMPVVELAVQRSVADAFFSWMACTCTGPTWHQELCSLLDVCIKELKGRCHDSVTNDSRIHAVLRLLDTRFNDSTLTLRTCATEMRLSTWRASRLIKEHTGVGFADHLHTRRVHAAEELLCDPRVSVKEIAAAVGYASTTQLGRHFRMRMKMTPIEYRRSISATRSAA